MLSHRPSPAMVVALVALVVALGGTAVAAGPAAKRMIAGSTVKKNSLPGDRVKKNTLPGDRLRKDSVGGAQVDESKLAIVASARHAARADRAETARRAETAGRADATGRADLAGFATAAGGAETARRAGSAATADSAARADVADRVLTYEPTPVRGARATNGATAAAALAAAPELPLARRGAFELYGKCIAVADGDPRAHVFARAAQAGSLATHGQPFGPGEDIDLGGGMVDFASGGRPTFNVFLLIAPDRTAVRGIFNAYGRYEIAELAGEPSPFGEDDCLFTATIGD